MTRSLRLESFRVVSFLTLFVSNQSGKGGWNDFNFSCKLQRWVLHAGVPVLWAQGFDKAAAIFRHGDVLWSLAIFISGLAWYFLVIPINLGTLELFAARVDRLALGWGCRSTALLLICQCCVYLLSHLSYYACFENLPTPLLAVLVYSACAVLVFALVWKCKTH